MTAFLHDRPAGEALATLVLAHGAGAPMDSDAMAAFAAALAAAGVAVARFEFGYMAARREGRRPPPPPVARLVPEFAAALDAVSAEGDGPLLVGGKSMGSRVAALLAAGQADPRVLGLVAWGFPFHPPSDPAKSRLPELLGCPLPALVLQGERDPFGGREAIAAMALPGRVRVAWFEDGDHDLRPRRASGHTFAGHLRAAAAEVSAFAVQLRST